MGASWPIRRVLFQLTPWRRWLVAAIHLGCALPRTSSSLPEGVRRAAFPSAWPCSEWGLPSRHSHLCRWCALTAPFHPYPPWRAVCFLWHCPAGHPGWPLATTLPCGARTFLEAVAADNRCLTPRPPSQLAHSSLSLNDSRKLASR